MEEEGRADRSVVEAETSNVVVTDNLPESFQASGAIGFYLAIAGGVLVAIAGLMPAKK